MYKHITVLKQELIDLLNLKPGDTAIDCTAGGGGHTELLLEKVGPEGKVIAFDRDSIAISHLREKFESELRSKQLELVHRPFSELGAFARSIENLGPVNAIIADIGVSSPQLDVAERGFSLGKNGPLDMRMDQSQTLTAANLVNELSREELRTILRKFGEEPKAHFIANAIVTEREQEPITTTARLAEIVKQAVHYKTKSKIHVATKTFQALRIVVNGELDELQSLLQQAFSLLSPQGRLGILSFHSLEDRMVKQQFNRWAGRNQQVDSELLAVGIMNPTPSIEGTIIKPYPLKASEIAAKENPRARSVRCRVIEKL